jgi:hypothetical protein
MCRCLYHRGHIRRIEAVKSFPLAHVGMGEGRGEGDLERRKILDERITLILTFSRPTGRRDQGAYIHEV